MGYRILVIRLGSLGDVVLTSAAVLNLKIAHPESHISFLTKSRFESVAKLFTGVDEVVAVPEVITTRDFIRILLELDNRNFDLVVDLHGNLRSWLARKLVGGGVTLAYPKRRLSRWLTVRHIATPDDVPHTIDLYNSALEDAGILPFVNRPIIHPSTLQSLPREIDLLPPNRVVIAPGAAHSIKQWPTERFLQVAELIIARTDAHIFWVAVERDRLSIKDRSKFGSRLTEFIDHPLEQLAPILANSRLAIANDTGLMHLASAVGVPVAAIFGPTHSSLGFSPRGLHDRIIEVDEYCRPCSLHGNLPCHRSEQFCFTRITAEMVVSQAVEMLHQPVRKAIFFDRDGTLMAEKHYLSDPRQVELLPGAVEALRAAKQSGYAILSISNQSGVARDLISFEAMSAVQARFEELLFNAGVSLDGSALCPHYRFGSVPQFSIICHCRKPFPGMAENLATRLNINLHQSVVIGDKLDDLNLGAVIGGKSILVRTGHGRETEATISKSGLHRSLPIFDSVASAVGSLLMR